MNYNRDIQNALIFIIRDLFFFPIFFFRCKGGSMCSTGCFAKFGSPQLDGLLHCSVEKND